jgi:hypothetical protein
MISTGFVVLFSYKYIKYYSAIKKSKIMSFAGKWMKLETIKLSEVSQIRKAKSHVFFHVWKINAYTNTNINVYIYVTCLQ